MIFARPLMAIIERNETGVLRTVRGIGFFTWHFSVGCTATLFQNLLQHLGCLKLMDVGDCHISSWKAPNLINDSDDTSDPRKLLQASSGHN